MLQYRRKKKRLLLPTGFMDPVVAGIVPLISDVCLALDKYSPEAVPYYSEQPRQKAASYTEFR